MKKKFKKIGLMGRMSKEASIKTLFAVRDYLIENNYEVYIEEDTQASLPHHDITVISNQEIGKKCDLIIVIGGDGSMLNAARIVVDQDVPVLGVNRGRLGFLTDIHPDELTNRLNDVLAGNYIEEKRFLLYADIRQHSQTIHHETALNDVVLLPGTSTHMIEFEIYINQKFVCNQRADGQIIATPTGSTAYALSGGGPILQPQLEAIVMVPMFSHTLSSRPIVVASDSEIDIVIVKESYTPQISCDGQEAVSVAPGSTLHIYKKPELLTLLHPRDYDYYETLRNKLHWQWTL